jgi:hypothetical protein
MAIAKKIFNNMIFTPTASAVFVFSQALVRLAASE